MADGAIGADFVNVETYGSGPRRIVALHCSLGRAAGWKAIAKALGDDFTITAPDWPGHGKSGPWTKAGLMREDAVAITSDAVGDDPVDLVGHSYGAIVALDYATQFPEKLCSLTLIEPIFMAVAGEDNRPLLDHYLRDMQPHFDALAEGRHEDAARLFMDIWGGGVPWNELPEPARAGLTQQIPVVDACKPGDENSPEERRVLENLHKLTMPVTLLFGGDTLPVVKLVMEGLQKRILYAKLVEISGAGHMVPLSHSKEVAEKIRSGMVRA